MNYEIDTLPARRPGGELGPTPLALRGFSPCRGSRQRRRIPLAGLQRRQRHSPAPSTSPRFEDLGARHFSTPERAPTL